MPDPIDRPDREVAREAAEAATAEDWSGDTLREALDRAAEWTVDYRKRVEQRPVLPDVQPGDVRRALAKTPPRTPEPFERVLADFDEHIVSGLTHWNHPGFLAYFSSSTRAPSIVAELLVAAVGVNAMLWRTSPAATEVERTAVDWLRQAVGLPESFSSRAAASNSPHPSPSAPSASAPRAGGRPSGRGEAEPRDHRAGQRGGTLVSQCTELDRRYTVRLSVGSVHTEERHLDDALEALHRAAADLSPGEPG